MQIPLIDLGAIGPEILLVVSALSVLLFDLMLPEEQKGLLATLCLWGILMALGLTIYLGARDVTGYAFSQMIALDPFAIFFTALFLAASFVTVLMSIDYIKSGALYHGEYLSLLLLATVGMILMVKGSDLIIIFLGIETLSLAVYVLAGFLRKNRKSTESSLKYFLLGAFSSAFLLYGIALVYGATGSTKLAEIALYIEEARLLSHPMVLASLALLLVGFGFKVALVPFHMWTPDVYEGAPTPVTAFMSVGVKGAAFAALLRVLLTAFPSLTGNWAGLLWILAVCTMTVGNVVAISQTNIKRMLAYSSIAHAGYLLVAVVAGGDLGTTSLLYYLLVYTMMNLGAFTVVIAYGRKGGNPAPSVEGQLALSSYGGMAKRYPLLAASMAIFMFSLAGIPPLSGFVGKFYIFSAAVKQGYVGLAVIGVLNSLISVFFYLRITVLMYMRDPEDEALTLSLTPALTFTLALTVCATIGMGMFPSFWVGLAERAVAMLV
jgi:NADH-quinone oxidoreductase subunit N